MINQGNYKVRMHILLVFVIGCFLSVSVFAKEATIKTNTTMRDAPYRDAKDVASLVTGNKITLVKRKGGWSQVKSKGKIGWVRTMKLRYGSASSGTSGSAVAGLATGRSGSGNVVATTGVRGLNEEELKVAKFNKKQIDLAEKYRSSTKTAKKFAKKAKLKSEKIAYLPN